MKWQTLKKKNNMDRKNFTPVDEDMLVDDNRLISEHWTLEILELKA